MTLHRHQFQHLFPEVQVSEHTIDPGSVDTTPIIISLTVPGVTAKDFIMIDVVSSTGTDTGIVYSARATGDNAVRIAAVKGTGGAEDPGDVTVRILALRVNEGVVDE